MLTIRSATPEDAPIVAVQRVQMFKDNHFTPVCSWEQLAQETERWTAGKLREGSYIGWLAEDEDRIVGGAGLWFMEFPPHWMHLEPMRGYLLNFYVAPEARGHGLAKNFVGLAVEACKQRGLHLATLHASNMGRPIYESLGWQDSTEMMLRLKP